MTLHRTKQVPLSIGSSEKSDVRTQFAALCYRVTKDKPQVLLISSRNTGRWVIPKGWPMEDKTPADAALQEAYEEAGVIGRAQDFCLGIYSYQKLMEDSGISLPIVVALFPVKVKTLASDYPEAGERTRKWFSVKKAATMVQEYELREILRAFDPRRLRP